MHLPFFQVFLFLCLGKRVPQGTRPNFRFWERGCRKEDVRLVWGKIEIVFATVVYFYIYYNYI